jgi:hydrogenase expression/formation protein HypD
MGYREYEPVSQEFKVPIVISGFEPLDLLQGTLMTVRQLENGSAVVENQYSRILNRDGNASARGLVERVFQVSDRKWRGVGMIPNSGYKLSAAYADYDAEARFSVQAIDTNESSICISGLILRGIKKPHDCPAFGTACTPLTPLGATMVSAEGACAAYYAYGRHFAKPKTEPGSFHAGGAA